MVIAFLKSASLLFGFCCENIFSKIIVTFIVVVMLLI